MKERLRERPGRSRVRDLVRHAGGLDPAGDPDAPLRREQVADGRDDAQQHLDPLEALRLEELREQLPQETHAARDDVRGVVPVRRREIIGGGRGDWDAAKDRREALSSPGRLDDGVDAVERQEREALSGVLVFVDGFSSELRLGFALAAGAADPGGGHGGQVSRVEQRRRENERLGDRGTPRTPTGRSRGVVGAARRSGERSLVRLGRRGVRQRREAHSKHRGAKVRAASETGKLLALALGDIGLLGDVIIVVLRYR